MKRIVFCWVSLALAHLQVARGGDEIFEAIVHEALAGNPELRMAESEVAAARGERRAAGQWKNPELSVEYGEKRVRDRQGDLTAKGNSQNYSISQTFEFPGKASVRKAIATRNIELAQLALEQLRLEVAAHARLLAVEWIATSEEALAAREVADRSATLVAMLGKRVPAGVQSVLDQRIIEASMVDIETRAREVEERRDDTGIALNVLRGKPSREPVRVKLAVEPPPATLAWEALWESALRSNFTLRSRALEMDRAARLLAQARLEATPDLAVGPFFSKENAPDHEKVVGVAASLPLPLWDSNRGRIEAARARVGQSESARDQALRDAERELTGAHASYLRVQKQLERFPVSQLDRLRESAELADRQYRLGAIQVQTYLDMQDHYLAAMSGTLRTLREGYDRFLRIQLLIGDSTLLGGSKPEKQP
ncbi:MAG: TolC family protein [Verrucomicrobiae bacterium]|nr:TolC family protein [Verrucomicrobiae bacterium]